MNQQSQPHFDKEDKIILELLNKSSKTIKPNPNFKEKLFLNLSEKYYSKKEKNHEKENFWQKMFHFFAYSPKFPALVASMIILVVGAGLTGVYAYVSPEVNEGDNLHSLKRAIENMEYSLTFNEKTKVEKNLRFAEKRKQEIIVKYNESGEINQNALKEIVNNMNKANEEYNLIQISEQKGLIQEKITQSSTEMISQLSKIVQEVEEKRVKVKKIIPKEKTDDVIDPNDSSDLDQTYFEEPETPDPEIENIKKSLEQIEKKSTSIIPCQNDCNIDQKKCFGNEIKECGNFDQDICLEFGGIFETCGQNQICENGACINLCTDQCSENERKCDGNATYKICGNFNNENCLGWSENITCPENTVCNQGACVEKKIEKPAKRIENSGCTNECEGEGNRSCVDNNYAICGNYDSDNCLELGEPIPCPFNTTCSKENGICVSGIQEPIINNDINNTNNSDCTNECGTEFERQCLGNGFQVCGNYDSDTCLEFGEVNECASGYSCENGACT